MDVECQARKQNKIRRKIVKTTFGNTAKGLQQLVFIAALAALPLMINVTGCSSGGRYHQSTGEYVDDHEMTAEVKRALRRDPEYKFPEIQVSTFKGVVQLSGFANTRELKSRAGEVAKSVPGVRAVENNITVKE